MGANQSTQMCTANQCTFQLIYCPKKDVTELGRWQNQQNLEKWQNSQKLLPCFLLAFWDNLSTQIGPHTGQNGKCGAFHVWYAHWKHRVQKVEARNCPHYPETKKNTNGTAPLYCDPWILACMTKMQHLGGPLHRAPFSVGRGPFFCLYSQICHSWKGAASFITFVHLIFSPQKH